MSSNIPAQTVADQRVANELFEVSAIEKQIIHLAEMRYIHTVNGGDPWGYDQKISRLEEEMNDKARKAIGPPPRHIEKGRQKFYSLKHED